MGAQVDKKGKSASGTSPTKVTFKNSRVSTAKSGHSQIFANVCAHQPETDRFRCTMSVEKKQYLDCLNQSKSIFKYDYVKTADA